MEGEPFLVAWLAFPLASSHVSEAVVKLEASSHSFMLDTSDGENSFLAVPWRPVPEESLAFSPSKFHRPCKLATPTGADGTRTPKLRLTTVPPELEAIARK